MCSVWSVCSAISWLCWGGMSVCSVCMYVCMYVCTYLYKYVCSVCMYMYAGTGMYIYFYHTETYKLTLHYVEIQVITRRLLRMTMKNIWTLSKWVYYGVLYCITWIHYCIPWYTKKFVLIKMLFCACTDRLYFVETVFKQYILNIKKWLYIIVGSGSKRGDWGSRK
jgi:hypothetical protein